MSPPKIIKEKFVESIGYWCNVIQVDKSFAVENTYRRRDRITRDGIHRIIEYFEKEGDAIDYLGKM